MSLYTAHRQGFSSLTAAAEGGTCAVPGPRQCPHPPHRGHTRRSGRMACQPCPLQLTWLQRASRQPQGQGRKAKEKAQVFEPARQHVVRAVRSQVVLLPNQPTTTKPSQTDTRGRRSIKATCYLSHAASLAASAVGDKSLTWVCHITGDAKMQHRQCTQPALVEVTALAAPQVKCNGVFPASPTLKIRKNKSFGNKARPLHGQR